MNCRNFQDNLQLFLDGVFPIHDEAKLFHHAKECRACADLHEAAHRLTEGLRLQPMLLPPPGFADRVVAQAIQLRLRPQRQQQWLAIAASVLVAGFALWASATWLIAPSVRRTETIAQRPTNHTHPLAVIGQRLDQVVPVTLGATRQVLQETVSTAGAFVPPVDRLSLPSLPIPMEVAWTPLREMSETVAISIDPVTQSAQKTWNAMWRNDR